MQGPTLIVIEDPTHRRAIVEDHTAGGIDHGRRQVRRGRRRRDGGCGIVRPVVPRLGLLSRQHGLTTIRCERIIDRGRLWNAGQ